VAAYARDEFALSGIPFRPSLRPIREPLANLIRSRSSAARAEEPYVPSLVLQRNNKRRR
jgi:hypothetical protein